MSVSRLSVCVFLASLAAGPVEGADDGVRLLALNPAAAGALRLEGDVSLRVAVRTAVNSVDPAAVNGSGWGVLETPELVLCGGVDFVGGRTLNGLLVPSDGPMADPLAWLKIPAGSGGAAAEGGTLVISGGAVALAPGEYAGGVKIDGGAAVTLAPGTYIFGGSGLNLASGSLAGAGVTLVMAQGALTLSGKAQLAAPDAGELAGVVIAQPAENGSGMSLSGGSATVLYGAVYAPGAAVALRGAADGGEGPLMGLMLVADRVKVSGSGWVRVGME